MIKSIKTNFQYLIGVLLVFLGIILNIIITNTLLEGEFFYFLRYTASPYILWGFISLGILVIFSKILMNHQLKKVLTSLNHPISYFVLFAALLIAITMLLSTLYGIIFVAIIVSSSIVLTMIYTKNYLYVLSLLFSIFVILEHLILDIFNEQNSVTLGRVFVAIAIITEIYLIVITVVKMNKKGIKRKDLNLFFDFTFLYGLTIYFASGHYTRTSGTSIEYLRNPNFFNTTILIVGYSTYMLYVSWKNHKDNA